jgi:hypothetical protein
MSTMIIVEDGTVIAGANSYQSVADLRAFATERALPLPLSDDDAGVLLLNAMDYMERRCGLNWVGFKYSRDQDTAWPRREVNVEGYCYLYTELPKQLLTLQDIVACELYALAGQDVMPTAFPGDHGSVAEEEVSGAVTIAYENNARVLKYAIIEKAERYVIALTNARYIRAIRA